MNIGDNITELRKVKKISQADLAKEAGVSCEIIGRYERNEVTALPDEDRKQVFMAVDALIRDFKAKKANAL